MSLTVALLFFATTAPTLTAITHVTVIDGTGAAPKIDQTVLVEGDHIQTVGAAAKVAVPANAKVVNGKGKVVMPGLWDMHTHLDDPELLEIKPTKTEKELQLPLMIATGVTGVRDMGGDLELMKDWRKRISNGSLLGPRMYFSGPLVDGPKPMWPASVAVETPDQGRKAVQELKRSKADFIKIYSLIPKDAYFAIADECKKQGLVFAGHVPTSVSNLEAVNAGQKSIEHLLQLERELADPTKLAELQKQISTGLSRFERFKAVREAYEKAFSETKAQEFYAALRAHGTWVTPTLNVLLQNSSFDPSDPVMKAREAYEPAYIREWWNPDLNVHLKGTPKEINEGQQITLRVYQRILKGLRDAKVPLLVGSDMGGNPHCFSGWGVHDEMAILVKSGLTPMDAIVAATSNPCRYLGIDKQVGTIAAGKLADLVILNANPLDDIHNTEKIDAVIRNGSYMSRKTLDSLLQKAKADGAKRIPQKGPWDTIESGEMIHYGS